MAALGAPPETTCRFSSEHFSKFEPEPNKPTVTFTSIAPSSTATYSHSPTLWARALYRSKVDWSEPHTYHVDLRIVGRLPCAPPRTGRIPTPSPVAGCRTILKLTSWVCSEILVYLERERAWAHPHSPVQIRLDSSRILALRRALCSSAQKGPTAFFEVQTGWDYKLMHTERPATLD